MNDYTAPDLKIIKNKKAPPPITIGSEGFYKKFFNSMGIGDWCVVTKPDVTRVRQQAATRLKGRYSMYKHPKQKGSYILKIVK